jgi:hypothetical protein
MRKILQHRERSELIVSFLSYSRRELPWSRPINPYRTRSAAMTMNRQDQNERGSTMKQSGGRKKIMAGGIFHPTRVEPTNSILTTIILMPADEGVIS